MNRRVLVTGGAGFIGSHTCLVLLEAGYDLLILDNFSNSSPEALTRVASLANVQLNSQRLQINKVTSAIATPSIRSSQTLPPAIVPLMPSSILPGSKRLANPSKNHFCTGM